MFSPIGSTVHVSHVFNFLQRCEPKYKSDNIESNVYSKYLPVCLLYLLYVVDSKYLSVCLFFLETSFAYSMTIFRYRNGYIFIW